MKTPLAAYYRHMLQKGYSKCTLKSVESVLGLYGSWVRMNHNKSILEVTQSEVEEYLRYLRGSVSQGTLLYKLSILRVFYGYSLKESLILVNPVQGLESIPRRASLPRYVPSESVMMTLLNRAYGEGANEIRNRAIMELMYSSALRRMEVIGLDMRDIDVREGVVYIRKGKGGKSRVVPVGREACRWIGMYLERVRPRYSISSSEEPLFLTCKQNRISVRVIHRLFSKYGKDLNAPGKITPHTLRHACALHMLRCGAPIEKVQELLGHRSLDSTQIYTRLYPKDLKVAHAKYHPKG